jgi:hypothetical protein
MVHRRNLKRSNRKSRSNRSLKRSQRGGYRGVHMPIQYFNPGAKVPTYYPAGHEMLTKPHVSSSYGTFSAVNTTNVNQGGLSMGPNLFPAPTSSGMMVGGRSRSRRSRTTTGTTRGARTTTGTTRGARTTTGTTRGSRTTTGTTRGSRTTTGTTRGSRTTTGTTRGTRTTGTTRGTRTTTGTTRK